MGLVLLSSKFQKKGRTAANDTAYAGVYWFSFILRSASEAERGQKKSMATASSAICHAPKLLTVIYRNGGLELCVQKGVVLLPASATLHRVFFPVHFFMYSVFDCHYPKRTAYITLHLKIIFSLIGRRLSPFGYNRFACFGYVSERPALAFRTYHGL